MKISAVDADPLKVSGQTFSPLGQGSGLLGIPGDPTPPSRFIIAQGAPRRDLPGLNKLARPDHRPLGLIMHLGSKAPKIGISWSSRRIRLGVAHHGAPSAWTPPVKEVSERKPTDLTNDRWLMRIISKLSAAATMTSAQ